MVISNSRQRVHSNSVMGLARALHSTGVQLWYTAHTSSDKIAQKEFIHKPHFLFANSNRVTIVYTYMHAQHHRRRKRGLAMYVLHYTATCCSVTHVNPYMLTEEMPRATCIHGWPAAVLRVLIESKRKFAQISV